MENKRKRKSGWKILFVLVIAVLVALLLAAVLRKSGRFSNLFTPAAVIAEEYFYDNASGGCFAATGDGFAVLSGSQLHVFGSDGNTELEQYFSWSSPALVSAGDYSAAYDIGGNEVLFFTDDGLIKRIISENSIVSASVNSSGYLCVCAEDTGYSGTVTVYNSDGTDIYKWYSGAAYVLSAEVRASEELMVLTVGGEGSTAVLMPLNSTEKTAEYHYDGLLLDSGFMDDGAVLVSDTQLVFLDSSLSETAIYDYSGAYLRRYSLENTSVYLVLSDYGVGGECRLASVSSAGVETASYSSDADILFLTSSGAHSAIIAGGNAVLFSADLGASTVFDGLAGVEALALRGDGTLIAAGAYSANTYRAEQ